MMPPSQSPERLAELLNRFGSVWAFSNYQSEDGDISILMYSRKFPPDYRQEAGFANNLSRILMHYGISSVEVSVKWGIGLWNYPYIAIDIPYRLIESTYGILSQAMSLTSKTGITYRFNSSLGWNSIFRNNDEMAIKLCNMPYASSPWKQSMPMMHTHTTPISFLQNNLSKFLAYIYSVIHRFDFRIHNSNCQPQFDNQQPVSYPSTKASRRIANEDKQERLIYHMENHKRDI